MTKFSNYIVSNRLILSSIGGWVENMRCINDSLWSCLKGMEINKCAVALFALSTNGSGSPLILRKASANPLGYLVNNAPEASAKTNTNND